MKRWLPLLFVCNYFISSSFAQVASFAQDGSVSFHSYDTALESAFNWAKAMALHYSRPSGDPVGPWYESALPPRDAFCMRDVSHQCIGAEILGLHAENKNMFSLFTRHLSASKDWCSYWEIDKLDRPSPSDYRNDREFWYNLDANFDLMDACWRSWCWTGDPMYLEDSAFKNFYHRTTHDYISRWILQPDSLLTRPPYPNAPVPFNIEDAFHRCRGLPSYSEGVHDLKMGIDLVAALYRGFISYAALLKASGHPEAAAPWLQKAEAYQQRIDADWWDIEAGLYNTYYSNKKQFGKTEGESFLLWFNALKDATRKQHTIEHLLTMDLGVENLSYLALQYYRNGYEQNGHDLVLHFANPSTQRREYPEVSFGVIEAIVQGLMGVDADATTRTVSTRYRITNGTRSPSTDSTRAALSDLPVLNTTITLTHFDPTHSSITNKGKYPFIWKAEFSGDHDYAIVDGHTNRKLIKEKDQWGQTISYLEITIRPGDTKEVRCAKD